MARLIDADRFCAFLREVSTRQHYERLLTNKDKYPTVADVIEEICCDLDGTSLNGFDNAPTVPLPDFKEGYKQAIRDGKTNFSRPQEWISVSERLPEEEGHCIVSTDYGDVTMDSFVDGIFVLNLGSVTAWQPLPKPYKEANND